MNIILAFYWNAILFSKSMLISAYFLTPSSRTNKLLHIQVSVGLKN